MAARIVNQDELDRLVGAWTREQEAIRVAGPPAESRGAGRRVPDQPRTGSSVTRSSSI